VSKAKKEQTQVMDEAVLMVPTAGGASGLSTDRFSAFDGGEEQQEQANALLEKASRMLEFDNHSGAIELISKAAELVPGHPVAAQLRLRCESTLLVMLESKLGDLEAIPFIQLRDEEILWLNFDGKTYFVLGKVDGRMRLGELLSLPDMSRLELARILNQLMDDGVIGIRAGNSIQGL
jgi:hypothetical protein